jgi:aminoglycoside 6'-N-acetyltransferase I
MLIRPYAESDWDEWFRMNQTLFPTQSLEEDEAEMRAILAASDSEVFVIERPDGKSLAGFVEVGTRSVVDGCLSSPVGYIEAWYVDPDIRRTGYGRALLDRAEKWAIAQGYSEMGSDALIDNDVSHAAHRKCGYVEVDRVITYRKTLKTN